jgi:hypothetical protein
MTNVIMNACTIAYELFTVYCLQGLFVKMVFVLFFLFLTRRLKVFLFRLAVLF